MVNDPKKQKARRSFLTILIILAVLTVGGVLTLRTWYYHNLSPVSSSISLSYFTVQPGSGVQDIADGLKSSGFIRNAHAFETYVRSNELVDKLQAGTYQISPSMSAQQIVKKIISGDVSRNLLTILPGKRLDQIQAAFKQAGYSSAEIQAAFDPGQYRDMAIMASVPKSANLEGLLYPDSFQKQTDTPAKTIVRESLNEMSDHLTADTVSGFSKHGLSTYKGVTLASIVEQESGDPADQPRVAQVFYLRLKQGMNLGSDVTAIYASHLAGKPLDLSLDSAYNTRVHAGLPPGPISNVTVSALQAVAHPASSHYLYFLFGDDHKMHFAYTDAEHQANIQKYCQKSCF